MTPKEKAKELVNKFIELTRFWDEDSGWVDDSISAKQCAFIAIDEIVSENLRRTGGFLELDFISYWKDVKQEIEKL